MPWFRVRPIPSPERGFELAARGILSLLIVALLAAALAGVVGILLDLRLFLTGEPHRAFKAVLADSLTVLVIVEVYRTAMAYFAEGRVKVTYIIDAVLVALLGEILAFWFREMEVQRLAMFLALVVSLGLLRVLAIHFSPNRIEVADGL